MIYRSTKTGIVFTEDYTQKWTKEKVILHKKGFSPKFNVECSFFDPRLIFKLSICELQSGVES
jgi:hypothetical protein